jgi:hypothetical protein
MANEIEPTADKGAEVPENAVLDLQTEETEEVEAHGCVSTLSVSISAV